MKTKIRARFKPDVEKFIYQWWYMKWVKKFNELKFVWEYANSEYPYEIHYVLEDQENWEIQMLINDEWVDVKIEI